LKRREFITLFGGAAAAWPLAAQAQQSTMPVVGFLRSTPADPFTKLVDALRLGLSESGLVEGANVTIDYRYADNHLERLPNLAAELAHRPVNVIVANSLAAEAARSITSTIPIVFVTADDPITRGLVTSLSRPGGNLTGLTFFGGGLLGAKRLELLHELVPSAAVVGFLMDPHWPGAKVELPDVQTAGRAFSQQIEAVEAASAVELLSVRRPYAGSRPKNAPSTAGFPPGLAFPHRRAYLPAMSSLSSRHRTSEVRGDTCAEPSRPLPC